MIFASCRRWWPVIEGNSWRGTTAGAISSAFKVRQPKEEGVRWYPRYTKRLIRVDQYQDYHHFEPMTQQNQLNLLIKTAFCTKEMDYSCGLTQSIVLPRLLRSRCSGVYNLLVRLRANLEILLSAITTSISRALTSNESILSTSSSGESRIRAYS